MIGRVCHFFKCSVFTSALFFAFICFSSCSNLFDDIKVPSADGNTVTITGAVANTQGQGGSQRAGRMALPSGAFAATEYSVTATAPNVSNPVSGSVNSDNNTFSIALALGKQWTITISMKAKETETDTEFKQVFQGSYAYDHALTAEDASTPISIVLAPLSGGTGNIDLAINPGSYSFTVEVLSEPVAGEWASKSPDYTSGIKVDGVTSGTYTVSIVFKNSDDVEVYSCTQVINVFDGMTTNKWFSEGGLSAIASDGTFAVTDTLVQAYGRLQFYVGETPVKVCNPDNGNQGSAYDPLKTVGAAISRIQAIGDSSKDYTIHISGTHEGNITLGSSLNSKMNSLTLCGLIDNTPGDEPDVLNGDGNSSVLTVSTTKPIIIRNLTITGGSAENGGGIYISSGATVKLADGVVVAGNNAHSSDDNNDYGGGVYNAGTLFMYSNAVIGDSSVEQWATSTTDSSNYAKYGGGLYNAVGATAYLGYSAVNTTAELTGGICYNYSYGGEAGAVYNNGTLKMNSGSISYNGSNGYVGGVTSTGDNADFELSGGAISHNQTYAPDNNNLYGGGIRICGSTFTMTGGEISWNTSNNGGGISLLGGDITFTGGVIKNNTAQKGSAVVFETGTFKIGGSAVVASGNDIWLNSDNDIATVTIYSALTGTVPVATLTPGNYSRTSALLTAGSGVTLANEIGKFAVTDNDTTDTNIWTLDSAGKLKSAMTVTAAITSIESMSGADNEVLIAGAITPDDITSIKSAISSAYTANGTTRIKLDLSNVTGLTELPYEAFKSLSALEEIILPEGIETLKSTFFCYGCSNLKSVYIPSSVTEFGAREFYGCPNLESITVADGNTALKVENDAVYSKDGTSLILYINKSNTDSFVVPDGVNRIDDYAFCQSNITSILLPDTLEYIGNNAFYYGKLNSINIPDRVTLESYAFYHCSLTSVRLPNDLEELGYCTFSGCGFTEITLPASIKKIGESYGGAFSNCDNLTTVNYRGTEAQRNAININDDKISNATWNYNYTD